MFSFSLSFCFCFLFPFSLFCSWFCFVCFPFFFLCFFLFCFCLSCLYSGPWSWLNAVKVKFSFSIGIGCSRLSCVWRMRNLLNFNATERIEQFEKSVNNIIHHSLLLLLFFFLFVLGFGLWKGESRKRCKKWVIFFCFYEFVNLWFSSPTVFMAFHACVCMCVCDVSVCLARKSLHTSRRCGRNYLSNCT